MKKAIIVAALACLAGTSAGVGAADEAQAIRPAVTVQSSGQMLPGYTISVCRGGEAQQVPAEAYEKNGVIMVPLRLVAERLGYAVTWDGKEQTACVEMGVAYMNLYPGIDMYERMGTLKTINLNHIYQYGAGPENVNGVLYVPAAMFGAFFNDVFIEANGLSISPQVVYLQEGM